MPLDPDPPGDPGATVLVKPGDYIVTLYRINWDEMRRAGIKTKLPEEFILLTPAQGAKHFTDTGQSKGQPCSTQKMSPTTPQRTPNEKSIQERLRVQLMGYFRSITVNEG